MVVLDPFRDHDALTIPEGTCFVLARRLKK
jgi:hypothetical protein